jgi:hypothetical protein
MASQLVLYVGTDLIIKCLSEHYLSANSQPTIRTLGIIKSYGATLIFTEAALKEVYTHLKAVDLEFRNHYMEIEPLVNDVLATQIDRILIRAYFYSKLGLNAGLRKPAGWRTFIGQFCTYAALHSDASEDSLRMYLCERFKMEYEPGEVMRRNIDDDELEALTTAIIQEKQTNKRQSDVLARNDAMHVLRVFLKRLELKEHSVSNPFGYRTWWLTHERAVRRAATFVFQKRRAEFIMRPEFLLNYIALAPTKAAVSKSYSSIFPTMLGVRLSQRLDKAVFSSSLAEIKKAFQVDEFRARAMISELLKRLPADQLRIYDNDWESMDPLGEAIST